MGVKIEILPWLSVVIKNSTAPINVTLPLEDSASLSSVLEQFREEQPEMAAYLLEEGSFYIKPTVLLVVNNKAFELIGGYEMIVHPGDEITFIPAYTGG